MTYPGNISLLMFALLTSAGVAAETVYITDQLQIGLHAEKSLGSPIVKIVATGTPLELIKTEAQLSFVREPGGTGGWIDNSYISPTSSANVLLRNAESRIRSLEASLTDLQQNQTAADLGDPPPSADEILLLQQQLDEERQRSKQLQNQIQNPGNPAGPADSEDSLFAKIEELSEDNTQLKQQLASVIENTPAQQVKTLSADSATNWFTIKNILISISILLVAGMLIGVYLMDFISRRRHGGFRI